MGSLWEIQQFVDSQGIEKFLKVKQVYGAMMEKQRSDARKN